MANFQVAIDGPAGSGKSSISKMVAKDLGFTHIDTGAMYRAITLEAINRKIDINDEKQFDFINDLDISYEDNKIILNGIDVSSEIRTSIVNDNVSRVSSYKCVRDIMLIYQRKIAKVNKVILDGRDIGSIVLPDANVKIFLTASVYERAKRRFNEINGNITFEELLESIEKRDLADSTREIAPLIQASDAVCIDTTDVSIEKVCLMIKEIICKKLKEIIE